MPSFGGPFNRLRTIAFVSWMSAGALVAWRSLIFHEFLWVNVALIDGHVAGKHPLKLAITVTIGVAIFWALMFHHMVHLLRFLRRR